MFVMYEIRSSDVKYDFHHMDWECGFKMLMWIAGLATKIPKPENMLEHVKASMYSPVYRMYR